MNKLLSGVLQKVGIVPAISIAVVLSAIVFIAPRQLNQTQAESCSPLYSDPIFNPYYDATNPATYQNTAGYNCRDFAPLVIKNVTKGGSFPTSYQDYANGVNASAGDELEVQIYIHNGARQDLGDVTTMHNISAYTTVDGNSEPEHVIGTTVTASNSVNTLTGSESIHTGSQDHLEIVSGSGQIYNYNRGLIGSTFVGGQAFTANLGDQQACFEFARFIVFKVKVVGPAVPVTPTPPPVINSSIDFAQPTQICTLNRFDGNVTWSTNASGNIELKVKDVTSNSTENLFAGGPSGSQGTPWLTENHDYLFTLYSNGQPIKQATMHVGPLNCATAPAPIQTINSFTASSDSFCQANGLINGTVSWNTSNINNVKVYVSTVPGTAPEKLLAQANSYNQAVNWLEPGYLYIFNLYGDNFGVTQRTIDTRNIKCATAPTPVVNSFTASSDNFCQANGLINGTVSWNTSNVNNVKVYVRTEPATLAERVMAQANTYTQAVNWLEPGYVYYFTLKGDGINDVVKTIDTRNIKCATTPPPANLACVLISGASTVNFGDTVRFQASGGNGTYAFNAPTGIPQTQSAGSNNTFATIYNSTSGYGSKTITAISNGQSVLCPTVVVNPPPVIPSIICSVVGASVKNVGESFTFHAEQGSAGFNWSVPGGTITSGQNSSNITATFSTIGIKNVTVTSNDNSSSNNCVVQVNPVNNVCTLNSNFAINADAPIQNGNTYSTIVRWSSTGNNQIKITQDSSTNTVTNGNNSGAVSITGLQPGSAHTFYMFNVSSDSACNTLLASVTVTIPNLPVTPTPTPTPSCTGNSCNNNTINNNVTGNNNNTVSNNTIINGNGNTVTNTNTCVNNSCNNTNTYFITTQGNTVPASEFRQLSITKQVRNVNGGSFANSVSVNNNDTVEFQIIVKNTGNQAINNVRAWDNLPSGLVYISGGNINSSLGTLGANESRTITFQARVQFSQNSSLQNTAFAQGDLAGQVQADAWVFVQQTPVSNGSTNLTFSKRAFNETKNVDATSVNAAKENFITYTLTVSNSGSIAANNFVITDDLSSVLPYADMVDNGGGNISGNIISFPGITIPAGSTVSKSFKVRVKYFLADNLSYVMSNTYGNTVTIRINTPAVANYVAPKTGADTNVLIFSSLLTLGFAGFRKRHLAQSLVKVIFT